MLITAHDTMNPAWRETMEDTYQIIKAFSPTLSYFGVYDGHGGRAAAMYCHQHLHVNLIHELRLEPSDATTPSNLPLALTRAYLATDLEFCTLVGNEKDTSGATAVSVVLETRPEDNTRILHTANVGDSRVVLYQDGVGLRRTSVDHKATDPLEMQRILSLGGIVHKERAMGMLAISRSFGDKGVKQWVPANPSTSSIILQPTPASVTTSFSSSLTVDECLTFIVLACDGVWDVLTDQDVVDFIKALDEAARPEASERLVALALKYHSTDNVTAIVVFL